MATWILFWTYHIPKASGAWTREDLTLPRPSGVAKVLLLLPYRANLSAGNCVGRWQAGNVSSSYFCSGKCSLWAHFCGEFRWQEGEGETVVEAFTEVSVFNHGRVEDGEVWTSLKWENWGMEKETFLSHTAARLLPVPTAPGAVWGLHAGLWSVEKHFPTFLLVSFLPVLLQRGDSQDLVLCSSWRWPSLTMEP